ncbi:DHS-like NAD/FAD-binding domain-containing protein [Artomyces pyxidatus]|uniref:DHS-like NAD/FAD-binding domain-containing protein n=1 Tax=Artomyces pyxidatus TaxID=48021 RepID=A0ACB8T102_9AGAM|nr:DHS-like NAD/FAD-binding domain-containing protein [Artomyces pyxidatus]
MPPSSDVDAFRSALRSAKSVIILAGAGLSAASGIPTYRGDGGLWKSNNPSELASPNAFQVDPSRVWQFYHRRREMCLRAQPNAAHKALAALSLPSVLSRVAPAASSPPLLITQNFDSLSLRAVDSLPPDNQATAREHVLEMHGSVFTTRCMSCQHVQRSYDTPLSSALANPDGHPIPVSGLPRCGGEGWAGGNRYGRCGGLLRPNVVWFGEVPEHMGEIARRLNWCDLLLVVGTSSLVHPAAGFARTVESRNGKVAIFNTERSSNDDDADFLFLGPCEDTLPTVLAINE